MMAPRRNVEDEVVLHLDWDGPEPPKNAPGRVVWEAMAESRVDIRAEVRLHDYPAVVTLHLDLNDQTILTVVSMEVRPRPPNTDLTSTLPRNRISSWMTSVHDQWRSLQAETHIDDLIDWLVERGSFTEYVAVPDSGIPDDLLLAYAVLHQEALADKDLPPMVALTVRVPGLTEKKARTRLRQAERRGFVSPAPRGRSDRNLLGAAHAYLRILGFEDWNAFIDQALALAKEDVQ